MYDLNHTCDNCEGIDPASCLFNVEPTPEEAEDWPTRYLPVAQVKEGDYVVDLGEFMKVSRVKTFEPYDSVQITARGPRSGTIHYAYRNYNSVWTLIKP